MSDIESFETSLCELMGYFYDNSYATRLCERIRRAHDREIAQARDPQRLRGTKPDTFNGAIEALREFRWQHATNDKDAIPYINAVKEMHDREIRDVSQQQYERGFRDGTQQEYHRGFEDGRHSMDAEHRVIAMKLRGLRFDGGSHENLSRIAYAIYPCATGWTCESADGLRDELVRLMGGVSDDTCGAGCCCAAADSDGDCGLQREEVEHGGAAVDCADDSRGWSRGKLVHMDGLVAYDVLWNERHKAVCELRKLDGCSPTAHNFRDALAASVNVPKDGAPYDDKELCHLICDRLIHLLGGDQPSGIDVLRAMDGESDTDETSPNDVPTSSITDELRKWMSTVLTSDDYAWAIADRIDEQFDRICQQQEAVLQATIEGMVKEYEHDRLPDQLRIEKLEQQRDELRLIIADVVEERDMWKATADTNANALLRIGGENARLHVDCERLRKRLDAIT